MTVSSSGAACAIFRRRSNHPPIPPIRHLDQVPGNLQLIRRSQWQIHRRPKFNETVSAKNPPRLTDYTDWLTDCLPAWRIPSNVKNTFKNSNRTFIRPDFISFFANFAQPVKPLCQSVLRCLIVAHLKSNDNKMDWGWASGSAPPPGNEDATRLGLCCAGWLAAAGAAPRVNVTLFYPRDCHVKRV